MLTEDAFVDFKCPYCEEPVSFPKDQAGFLQACPNCTQSLVVPDDGSDAGRKPPLPVTASRLVLRRFGPGDWKDLLELMPEAGEDYVLHWLERDAHVRLTSPEQTIHLGIELKEGGKLVGYFGLKFLEPDHRQATFELTLNEQFRKEDLGMEAVDALLGFCFKGIRLHRVTATCESRNADYCRLLENVGMRREGEFVKDRWVAGEWINSAWYAALNEEYQAEGENPPA